MFLPIMERVVLLSNGNFILTPTVYIMQRFTFLPRSLYILKLHRREGLDALVLSLYEKNLTGIII